MKRSVELLDTLPLLRRLRPDGQADRSFHPELDLSGASSGLRIDRILEQSDGKILVSGEFPYARGNAAKGLTRLDADGREDASFRLASEFPALGLLAFLRDGKILAYSRSPDPGPWWSQVITFIRLLPNGEVDESFQSAWPGWKLVGLNDVLVSEAGQILVAGHFVGADPDTQRRSLLLLEGMGAMDPAFDPVLGSPSAGVWPMIPTVLAEQVDGKILINGALPGEEPRTPDTFGRLLNSPAFSVLQVSDNSALHWKRGGSAPELTWVTFEARAVGSAEWTPLGAGTRIPGGWSLADATLPERGSVRARGFTGRAAIASAEVQLVLGGAEPMLTVEFPSGIPLPAETGVIDCGETWLHRSRATAVVLRNSGDTDLRGTR